MRLERLAAIAAALGVAGASMPVSAAEMPEALFGGLEYRMIGPSRGGRVTAVAGHRDQRSTFYMGATGGGVWKTTDSGQTWRPISDGFFATGSIGAIAVAESDPDIVYVATGSDGLRSNVIIGKGVYKSTDAGETWHHAGLEKVGNTGAVLVHPDNPELVYVAAIGNPFAPNPERGVYRSRDGGKGWKKVLFVSERTGAVDLEFAPDDPNTVYATMWRAERKPWTIISGANEGGVYKSTDGGDTWKQATNGLPTGLRGKADLAVSAADPERVYVLIEAPAEAGGVYRSDDRGESWQQVSDFQPIRNRPFYYTNLEAHPKDPDVLWGMAEGFYRSEDAGETWERQSVPHGDNHDMWINPGDPDIFIQANDGGANVTLNGGETWSTQHNQPTAELYQLDVSDGYPYRLYSGQQDNSTISVPSLPPLFMPGGHTALWEAHGGCETGPAVPRPGDPDIVYANCKGRFGYFNRRTGQEKQYYVGFWNIYGHNPRDLAYRFQRVAPIHVSPHDPDRVYHTSQYVHVTTDGGRTWEKLSPDLTAFTPETQVVSGDPITLDVTGEEHFSVIYDIQESPHEPGVIWVGANDGPIHVTRDNGLTWKDVTPGELARHGRVQQIEVSPHDPATAYACVLRYLLGDFAPYVFKTTDYGVSWTRLTSGENGIPADHPVRVVREDPVRPGLLYAGTEFGMFISFDAGANWQSFQLNLPSTPVTDIKLVENDLALSTMGRSFWILYDVARLHQLDAAMADAPAHLFEPSDAVRRRSTRGMRAGSTPADPQYPDPGVNIDYSLAEKSGEALRLEVLDPSGRLVREFSSESPGESEVPPAEAGMREPRMERVGTPALERQAGAHRFVWDMRHAGPWHADAERSGRRGPLAAPGRYQVRLSLGDWSETSPFELRFDPRIVTEGVTARDVEAQLALSLAARDALSRARKAAARVETLLEDEQGGEEHTKRLEKIKGALATEPIRYSRPMLVDQLAYVYYNLDTADQAPGRDAEERLEELTAALDEQLEALEDVLGEH